MEIQQLRYIIALSQELNFNRAAAKVGISQPTLSQQIKKLEEELQTPLFERSAHSVRLTPAGKTFLPYARQALESLNSGVNELKDKEQNLSGTLSLAFIPTIGPYILPTVLKVIKKKAPNLKLKLYEETTSVLCENLKSGKFDLGLLALPLDDPALVTKKLGTEAFYLVTSKQNKLSHKKSVTLKDVLGQNLIMLQEGHCFRDQALDFCNINQNSFQLAFEGSSLVSVLNLVQADEGISFIPEMTIDHINKKNLTVLPFKGKTPKRDIGAIWRMTTPLNKTQKFVLGVIEEILQTKKAS